MLFHVRMDVSIPDDLDPDVWWMDLEAPARGPAVFSCTPGTPVARARRTGRRPAEPAEPVSR